MLLFFSLVLPKKLHVSKVSFPLDILCEALGKHTEMGSSCPTNITCAPALEPERTPFHFVTTKFGQSVSMSLHLLSYIWWHACKQDTSSIGSAIIIKLTP